MRIKTDKLIEQILEKQLSVQDLVKISGLSKCCLHEIIAGRTRWIQLKTLARISEALQVPWQSLVEKEAGR